MTAAELSRRQVRQHFNAHAEEYDRYAIVQQQVVDRLGGLFDWSSGAPGPVLEIGTGTGGLAERIQRQCPGQQLVISDLAHGMTLHARERLALSAAVDADAGALPFTGGRFAGVASSSVYQWVEPLPEAFREVFRVLRPGGWFVFALFGEESLCELKQSHRQALVDCGSERTSHVQEFPALVDVSLALESSGLACSQLVTEREIEFHADVPTLLRALKRIGAGNASKRRPPGMASRAVMTRMMELYRQGHGCKMGIPATYEVIYGIAEKPLESEMT